MKICKDCNDEKSLDYFYNSKNHKDGKESFCISCRKKRNKKWISKNKEKHSKLVHDNYNKTKDVRLAYSKQYYLDNREEHLERSRINHNKKYNEDPSFRIRILFSNAIRHHLTKNNSSKGGKSWFELVPYTLDDLKLHLESQFDEYMNWDNYGSYWQIDHIKPASLFKYDSPTDPEFQECWSLQNLQPLYWLDNNRKSNKY